MSDEAPRLLHFPNRSARFATALKAADSALIAMLLLHPSIPRFIKVQREERQRDANMLLTQHLQSIRREYIAKGHKLTEFTEQELSTATDEWWAIQEYRAALIERARLPFLHRMKSYLCCNPQKPTVTHLLPLPPREDVAEMSVSLTQP